MALSHDHKPMSVTEKSRIQRAGGFVNAVRRDGVERRERDVQGVRFEDKPRSVFVIFHVKMLRAR